jgi:hypothetical protein
MKLNKELMMKIALVVFAMIAAIAGYEVVQDDDSVTLTLPEAAVEAPVEAPAVEEKEAPAEKAEE